MAWPFSTVAAPNLDTGPGASVPTSTTAVTASACWLLGAVFTNNSAAERTMTVTDTAGDVLCQLKIPVGGEVPYDFAFRPATGVKWFADAAGVLGHLWGYV